MACQSQRGCDCFATYDHISSSSEVSPRRRSSSSERQISTSTCSGCKTCNSGWVGTVVKTPGLPSPCTMKCGEGLLTAFSVGFTPHIQRQTRTDLRLRPHPVDTLLHLAIAPV